jgi:hypothetical protein
VLFVLHPSLAPFSATAPAAPTDGSATRPRSNSLLSASRTLPLSRSLGSQGALGGRRTLPMRSPSPRCRGLPSWTMRSVMLAWWLLLPNKPFDRLPQISAGAA